MRLWSLVATLIALGGAAGAAPQVKLVYTREPGAEPCPDEPAVRLAVAARLGYDPFVDGEAERTVRATLGPAGRWLRATIELVDQTGELLGAHQLAPRLRGCDALASAMELAIAIAIDPLRATAPPPPPTEEPSPSPSPQPVNVAVAVNDNANANENANVPPRRHRRPLPPTPSDAPDDPRDDESRVHLMGRLAVLAAVGSAPAATWGVELGLAAQWHRFSVGVELRGDLPASSVTGGGTVSSTLIALNFLPCVRAYGLFFCGLLSGGVVIAYGSEFPVDRRVALPYFAGGARVGVELKLGRRMALGLHADLVAPFTRALLQLDEETLFHAQPVSGAFGLQISGVLK